MFTSALHVVFMGLLDLAIFAAGVFYTGLVLMSYRTNGAHHRPHVNLHEPARSAERLVVWLGVKLVAFIVSLSVPVFGMLSEASAEVGEWYLRHRDPQALAALRSRFMV